MKKAILFAAIGTIAACLPVSAFADALFMTVPETVFQYTQYGNDGFIFTPTSNLMVTALDYYVSPFSDNSLNDSHGVGIYDVTGSHSAPLVQTVIGPGTGTLVGGPGGDSYFLSISVSSTPLLAGHEYMLAGYSVSGDYENGGSNGYGIPLGSLVLSDATLDGYYYDYNGSLDYPTIPYSTAFVGPNFEATAIPEAADAGAARRGSSGTWLPALSQKADGLSSFASRVCDTEIQKENCHVKITRAGNTHA